MMDPVCTFVVHIIGKNDYARINKSNQERLELHKVISCRMTKTLATQNFLYISTYIYTFHYLAGSRYITLHAYIITVWRQLYVIYEAT